MTNPLGGLQGRFSQLIGVAMLSVVAVIGMLIYREHRTVVSLENLGQAAISDTVSNAIESSTRSSVNALADSLANSVYERDLEAIQAALDPHLAQPTTRYVVVFDIQGRVIEDGSNTSGHRGRMQTDPMAAKVIASPIPLTLESEHVLDISAPIEREGEKIGGIRVGINLDIVHDEQAKALNQLRADMDRVSRNQRIVYVLAGVALLLTSIISLLYVRRRIVAPLSRLVDATEEYEGGNYIQIDERGLDQSEIGSLTRSFNRMGVNLQRYDEEIRSMAYTDALTGLPNREALRVYLREAMAYSPERAYGLVGVLFFDIDNFKRINDTRGHFVGDRVLVAFADRVNGLLKKLSLDNAMFGRFGGDEFIIVLPVARHSDTVELAADSMRSLQWELSELAQRILDSFEEPITAGEDTIVVGTSIGIAIHPDGDISETELIKRADSALYRAKETGKSCFRFYDYEIQQQAQRLKQLELALDGAWQRGEIEVAYQPIVHLATGTIRGFEALLRWTHPDEGSIDTEFFIGLAERSGVIDVLGEEMMARSFADFRQLLSAMPEAADLKLTVNISPHQLRDGVLPGIIERHLQRAGLSPTSLGVELTESAMLEYSDVVEHQLNLLSDHGIEIWLDDFGTGYSGLSHLRHIKVSGVKIDRSFISDILFDEDDRRLTSAILSMAESLGITVIAEGIEQQEQLQWLRERRCELGQGYHLGRPIRSERLVEFMRERQSATDAISDRNELA